MFLSALPSINLYSPLNPTFLLWPKHCSV